MFEHKSAPLLPRSKFFLRMLLSLALGSSLVFGGLLLGILGYHLLEGLEWLDALLNSSMILAGMGPVNPMQSAGGKFFASGFALFSGVAFPTTIAIMMAPLAHRFLHKLHLDEEEVKPHRKA